MSYTTDRYSLENANLGNMTITTCGITANHPGHTSGKRIYQDYSLHFIVKGEGDYIINGKAHHLKAGEGFMIPPGLLNEYIGDKADPWEYIYIGLLGYGAENLLKDIGLDNDNVTFTFPTDIIPQLYSMHAAGKNKSLKGYGIWGEFILIISRLTLKGSSSSLWSPEKYVKEAKRFIKDNFAYDITVEDVASKVCIDRTYLYRLFMKHENTTPSKYILGLRLEEAAKKLKETDASISEIALSSGFSDAPHFYKAFYNKYKISPKKFREGI